jgi:hypothetical protein
MNDANSVLSRRMLLKAAASGFGYLAFAGLSTWAAEKSGPLAAKPPHFPARAKRIIFLCMEGAPSHVDTFDYKPRLALDDGKPLSARAPLAKLMASPWKFAQHGQGGLWVSELFPEVAKCADHLCVVRSMQTDVPAHPQAFVQMHTGAFQFKRPSLGAWTVFGLGTENENLPGFITINPPIFDGGPNNYGSSFLPAIYQGTAIGAAARPGAKPSVNNIRNPKQSPESQREQLAFIQSLNRQSLEDDPHNLAMEGAIDSFELAFRMQRDLPELLDLSHETAATKSLYGIDQGATDPFGRQCLLARRCIEAGVRFVEVGHPRWDHHFNLREDLARNCGEIDRPVAGLLKDLESRGLLQETLVLWGGEFGRTPYAQNGNGRDHNHKGFTMWLAGGGVKGGHAYGQTDEHGYEAVENKVHVHDLHATILHLLGLDHEKLTVRHGGREMRLTDMKGAVVKGVLA